jgi:hypothetical protein
MAVGLAQILAKNAVGVGTWRSGLWKPMAFEDCRLPSTGWSTGCD